jgi:hypothetical protein
MSASTMKMPDPIIDPITNAVELKSPRLCTKWGELPESAAAGLRVCPGVVT